MPSYKNLTSEEKLYISRRYPNLNTKDDVIPVQITRQPDMKICGVFAGAVATSLCLKDNPSAQNYSTDPVQMRQHFFDMIKYKEITPFPLKQQDTSEIIEL